MTKSECQRGRANSRRGASDFGYSDLFRHSSFGFCSKSSCPAAQDKNMLLPMSATILNTSAAALPRRNLVKRLASILLLAFIIGWVLNRVALQLDRADRPAGFVRGLVQGALMPASMPNLLIGHDVVIYAVKNNGVFYKLGYTMGVNGCGAVFFGIFYFRLNRCRSRP
jgi:hypothetical protein